MGSAISSTAWEAADRFLARHSPYLRRPEERRQCLIAVAAATAIIAGDPVAIRLFVRHEEIFLLLIAQGMAESHGNPKAMSPQGDLGWAQINRRMLAVLKVDDPFDLDQNAAGQARHLRALLVNFYHRWGKEKTPEEILRLALAAYNASSRRVKDGKIPPGPVDSYVERVMKNYRLLKGEMELLNAAHPPWRRYYG